MAVSSLATAVMTPLVEFWVAAAWVVMSSFSPASFFSSTPVSSMKAPRVPEPSSRVMTVMSWSVSKSEASVASADSEAASLVEAAVLSEEAAVLSEEAAVLSEAVLPQAARLSAMLAASTEATTEVRFITVSSPFLPNLSMYLWWFCCSLSSGSRFIVPRRFS